MYLFLVLTILFTRTSCARNLIIHYLCCMVTRRSGYLTRAFDCTLVKVLHYSLIERERRATASQDYLVLTGEVAWRQYNRPQLHCKLTLRSPSGTLGMGVATRVIMRVVVTTPLTVTLSLSSEPKPLPYSGYHEGGIYYPSHGYPNPTLRVETSASAMYPTGTLLWSSTSVMRLTRLSAWWKGSNDSSIGWMTLHMCKRRCKPPSTHRPA
jgi:hypothetical protein